MAAEDRITSIGNVGFSTKVKTTVKVSCWVPLACRMRPVEMEIEQQLMVVRIVVFAVQKDAFRPIESGDVLYTSDSNVSAAQR